VAADAGGDEADVDVEDRRELILGSGRAGLQRIGGLHLGRDAHGVQALREHEALDQVGHGVREDRLLVGHRSTVVDHQEQVDLVDRALGERLDDRRRGPWLVRLERPVQTASYRTRASDREERRYDLRRAPQPALLYKQLFLHIRASFRPECAGQAP